MPIAIGGSLVRYFSNANGDGSSLGQNPNDPVSLYGPPFLTEAQGGGGGTSTSQKISGAVGAITLASLTNWIFADTSIKVGSFVLPSAGVLGRTAVVVDYNGNSEANPITVTVISGGLMNGSPSPVPINADYAITTFVDNGTSWNY